MAENDALALHDDFGWHHASTKEGGKWVAIIALLMMGCATTSWNHPKGMGDFERDHERCAQLAGQQAMDMDPHTGTTVEQVIDDCLQRKGYVRSRERR